ncbi:Fe-S cluster assembly protein SufD [Clostridium tertium]|jgi:FeS assembly protein SufD|uniref:Fe-S cluster assembly protein SufD n=1 Tax=Clostridium tertium TaxID=1559 RepID=UPI000BE2AFDC|nr:Fe-S cluster assembly protein SufD [Clostridium tertium]MBU6136999.1 Fe-S cluster assembly protein SufD [Clostridium tertium]MDB1939470.1 Fe-S cluster assembly protein SufD [Clostridium tertium]MDY4604719.1 Fe-S cluster assembly protein SufD [Clostridium tertium]
MNNNLNFNNLNKTPVRTKSWLNVNDITLRDYKAPEIGSFNNDKITGSDLEGVTIEKLNKGNVFPLNKKFIYGVSDEIVNQGEFDFNKGYVINIAKNAKVQEPIIIEFNMDNENKTLVDNILIVAEEDSNAKVIIKYNSLDDSEGYHNGVCKIFSKNNSNIQVVKVNLLNKNTMNLDSNLSDVGYNGKVDFVSIDLGGKNSITNYHGDLLEDNSESTLSSIYLGGDKKVIDMNYVMTHKGRRSKSEITTKGALKGEANKIFRGTLDFKRGASRSVGVEDEYCMILSPQVKGKALPLLLCEEDDVSGEHAAASGKIDEAKLFYLMSRGLSYNDARRVIIEGAFNPIIDKIDNENIREAILASIKECLDNE